MDGYDATLLATRKTLKDILSQVINMDLNWEQQRWIINTVQRLNLVKHSEYLVEEDVEHLCKLIYAYKYKGTYRALRLACESLVGTGITIIKSPIPGLIYVSVAKASNKLSLAVSNTPKTKAVGTYNNKAIENLSLKDSSVDLLIENLIKEFLVNGIKIRLYINNISMYVTDDSDNFVTDDIDNFVTT